MKAKIQRANAWRARAADSSGASAVEFALVLPLLLLILFSILTLGLAWNNYIQLTDGVREGARQFSIGRGSTTPWSSAEASVYNGAPNLTKASIVLTFTVNGTACGSDAACIKALTTAGTPTNLTATYPCSLTIMGVNFAPSGCNLTSSTTELEE